MAIVETAPPSPTEQNPDFKKEPSVKTSEVKNEDSAPSDSKPSSEQDEDQDDFQDCEDGLKQDMIDLKILGKIDKLRDCGAGLYLDLPELVVVGGQSSGKSSVLEGLSKLPFPRKSGLCTRFATRITFQRTKETYVSLSVKPAVGASAEYREKLQRWQRRETRKLTKHLFSSIINEVHEVMGLVPGGAKGMFSQDTLQIEICGPSQQHFAIVDVPGIFHAANSGARGATTEADIELVNRMVQGHMQNQRSVMLVVLPANTDPSTQVILKMARDADPAGDRTLGVLTKPDLAGQDLDTIKDLLNGHLHPLKLGWCVVMNSSKSQHEDPSQMDRDLAEEQFFSSNPVWQSFDQSSLSLGIASLKQRLREILADHIRREFPHVKAQVRHLLSEAEAQLHALGYERNSPDKQRRSLLDLCVRFQAHKANALNADYSTWDAFGTQPFLRLPTKVVERSQQFANDVREYGHSYELGKLGKDDEDDDDSSDDDSDLDSDHNDSDNEDTKHSSSLNELRTLPLRHFTPCAFDQDIQSRIYASTATLSLAPPPPIPSGPFSFTPAATTGDTTPAQDTLTWLRHTYTRSRGSELGTFNKSLLAITMKEQSSRWEQLALGYISDVIQSVHAFICYLLHELSGNQRVCEGVMSQLMPELYARYDAALAHAAFLARVELDATPMTLSREFEADLASARRRRRVAGLRAKALDIPENVVYGDDIGSRRRKTRMVKLSDIEEGGSEDSDDSEIGRKGRKGRRETGNVEATIRQLHDNLNAYYHVARRRFIDNVCMQAAAHHLLATAGAGGAGAGAGAAVGAGVGGGGGGGAGGPLDLFSSAWVSALSEDDLEEIAGEEAAVKLRRKVLGGQILKFSEAWKILS